MLLILPVKTALTSEKTGQAEESVFHSWDGYVFPTRGTYRALIIYVNIIYNDTISDPVGGNEIWPQAALEGINVDTASWPQYMHNYIDTAYPSDTVLKTFTRIYAESSFHELIILGDYMVVNIKHTTISGGGTFTAGQLLDSVMQMINVAGGINTVQGYNSISDYAAINDSVFDYVKFIIRNSKPGFGDFGVGNGSGGAGNWVQLRTIEGGPYPAYMATVQCVGNSDLSLNPTSIVVHEFSHLLFGGVSFHTSGGHSWGGKMCFPGIQYGYGLMGGASSGLVSCNGFDRFRAGWMAPDNNTGWPIVASEKISDVSRADGNQVFILRDFVSTGDAVRIKLPHLNPPASNQYIWLENHKILDSNLDFLQYENTHDCRPKAQKGIYAYYQVGKDTIVGERNSVYTSHDTDNLKIICANGNYDQQYAGTIQGNCIGSGQFSYFIDVLPNALSGNNDLSAYFLDIPGNDTLKPGLHARNAMAKTYFSNPNDTVRNLPYLMSDINAFSGYRELSLNTNPAPFNTRTYYHSPRLTGIGWITEPVETFRNQDEIILSGLRIVMTPIENDDYQVEISWNNYDLNNDVRWTGQIQLVEELYINQGATLLLDQNLTPNMVYRNPVTGLFSDPTQMRCTQGSLLVQRAGSNLFLDNRSILKLESGSLFHAEGGHLQINNESVFLVADGGVFRQEAGAIAEVEASGSILIEQGGHYIIDGGITNIKAGGRLEIESCATLEIRNGGMLIIGTFAEICIHPGAYILFDSLQNISFGFGFSTGNCQWFTPATFLETVVAAPPTYQVTGITEWNNVQFNLTENLFIAPSATLNINGGSELRFAPGKRIVVDRGAGLNLIDSKLTNLCQGQPWDGIEVWGNSLKSQAEQEEQGTVYISDRAVIDNAVIGVLAGKRIAAQDEGGFQTFDPAFGGGIIIAEQSTFRNNQTGIYLTPYENKIPELKEVTNNQSRIKDCEFRNTGDIYDDQVFVKLNTVRGIELKGNLFTGTLANGSGSTGILSLNSSFSLKPSPAGNNSPFEGSVPNRFNNLRYGIRAFGTGSERTFIADSAIFLNTNTGIFTSAVNNFRIINSLFRIPFVGTSARRGGLYVDGPAMGFQIEGNRFSGSYSGFEVGTGLTFGASFNNTGASANIISNNAFDSLHVAVLALNQNRHEKGFTGLSVRCNDFMINRHAIMVLYDKAEHDWGGIAPYQGAIGIKADSPAGNSFSPSMSWEAHIYNHAKPFLYFHSNPATTPYLAIPGKITPDSVFIFETPVAYVPAQSCPFRYILPGQADYDQLLSSYQSQLQALEEIQKQYSGVVDGGKTSFWMNQIETGHPANAPAILGQLMKMSPWLSDSVLYAAISAEKFFPDAMIRDLLVANPQSTRSPQMMLALQKRLNRMPDYMKDDFLKGKIKLSAKEAFEADMLEQHLNLLQVEANLIQLLSFNSAIQHSYQSLLDFYQNHPGMDRKLIAAMMLAEQGNIFGAGMIVNALPQFQNSGLDLAEGQANLKAFIEKMYLLAMAGKSIFLPDSMTVQWLQNIANASSEPTAQYARNILIANGYLTHNPVYLFPALVDAPPVKPPLEGDLPVRKRIMNVFPNPASTYIVVDLDLSHISEFITENPILLITGLDGRRIASQRIGSIACQQFLHLVNFPAGAYIISLYLDDMHLQSEKLIVIKR